MTDQAPNRPGFLLIADITGYTIFLSKSELEHARDTLTSLLETVISGTRPPLIVSKLEGDAVLSYGLQGAFLSGQTLLEMVEGCYASFRRAIELMVLNNTCRCNACANVSSLDLKFFVHHGEFAIQGVGGGHELFGPNVILVHRLLKNDIKESLAMSAYTAYTEAAASQIGPQLLASMRPHVLTYDDVGPVRVFVQDMHPVWEQSRARPQVELPAEQVLAEGVVEIGLSPEVVWDYLSEPEFRKTLIGSDSQQVTDRRGGRIAEGSVFQCYHGVRVIPELIVEWKPFQRMVTRDRITMLGMTFEVFVIFELDSTDSGTRLTQRFGGLTGPWLARAAAGPVMRRSGKKVYRDLDRFRGRIEADYRTRVPVA